MSYEGMDGLDRLLSEAQAALRVGASLTFEQSTHLDLFLEVIQGQDGHKVLTRLKEHRRRKDATAKALRGSLSREALQPEKPKQQSADDWRRTRARDKKRVAEYLKTLDPKPLPPLRVIADTDPTE